MLYKSLNKKTKLFLAGSLISFLSAGTLLFHHKQQQQLTLNATLESAKKQTIATSLHIDKLAQEMKTLAKQYAEKIIKKPFKKDEIETYIKKKPVTIAGFGVAFNPGKTNMQNFAPYYVETEGKQKLTNIAQTCDYTCSTWFQTSIKMVNPGFVGPFYDPITNSLCMFFVAPFFQNNENTPAGIIFTTQSVEHFEHIIKTLHWGDAHYWFLLSDNGTLLSHPNKALLNLQTTITDIAKQNNNNKLITVSQKALSGIPAITTYTNEMSHQQSWILCEPIKTTGWVLCGAFNYDTIRLNNDKMRRTFINILLTLLLAFLFLFSAFFGQKNHTQKTLWTDISLLSMMLTFTIGLLWNIITTYPAYVQNTHPIDNKMGLHRVLDFLADNHHKKSSTFNYQAQMQNTNTKKENLLYHLSYNYKNQAFIPTGIFISHLEFKQENQINISGYIWQRYYDTIHDSLKRGFVLPQAIGNQKITEIYRTKQAGQETIIWHIDATLNQKMNFKEYPFDVKDIEIQIWHTDFAKNIVLLPDLDSYIFINPAALPGLDQDIDLPGWTIQASYFGYKKELYNTLFGLYTRGPFGLYRHIEKSSTPELFFNITAKRHLADTLISDLLPITVILVLLFVIFLTSTQQGYTALGSYAAIFFGSAFAQARFRTKIPADTLVYFEHFYFIIYAVLVSVIVITIFNLLDIKIHHIQHRHNLLPKLLFWPIVLSTIILVSLYYLY
jgi:hypothetical protein